MSEVHPKFQPTAFRVSEPPSTCCAGPLCHATLGGGWMCRCQQPTPPAAAPVRAFPSAAINPAYGGMELRDWFAGQALAGLMSACDSAGTWQTVGAEVQSAVHAYAMADAMLALRSRG